MPSISRDKKTEAMIASLFPDGYPCTVCKNKSCGGLSCPDYRTWFIATWPRVTDSLKKLSSHRKAKRSSCQ